MFSGMAGLRADRRVINLRVNTRVHSTSPSIRKRHMDQSDDPRWELANALTHGAGVVASLAGGTVLIVLAALYGDAWKVVSSAIFVATLVVLYTASTVYHAVTRPELKARLKVFDHSAIYLLIAGTYTPFMLV